MYPFFRGIFGSGWPTPMSDSIGAQVSIVDFISLPWTMTMFPGRLGGENIGPIYLLFLPLAFLGISKYRFVRLSLPYIIVYTLLWYYIVRMGGIRYFFPVLLPLGIMIALGIYRVLISNYRLFKRYIIVIFATVILFNLLLSVYHTKNKIKVVTGLESRDSYLGRVERSYSIGKYIDENLPQDSNILMVGEIRSYYLQRPYIHFRNYFYKKLRGREDLSPEEFKTALKEDGVSHILAIKNKLLSRPQFLSHLINKYTDLIHEDMSSSHYQLYHIRY